MKKIPRIEAMLCPKCGMAPKITAKEKPADRRLFDHEASYAVETNPDCPVCGRLARRGAMVDSGVKSVVDYMTKRWNLTVPAVARVVRLDGAGKLAPLKSGGCGAMTLELSADEVVARLQDEPKKAGELAGIADDAAFVDELFSEYACAKCSILGDQCPRDTESKGAVKNMKCCLPAYAASKPADKLDDETLAAVAGMVGCLGCDCLGKHWYLEECDQCNCPGVEAHLKCYYLAAEYRKRQASRKESAK